MPNFPRIKTIAYEGPKSTNPLAFKHYNPAGKIGGQTLKDWMRFSIVYWHSFRGVGGDAFGPRIIRLTPLIKSKSVWR